MKSILRPMVLYLSATGVFLAIAAVNLGLAVFLVLILIAAALGNPNSSVGWGLLGWGMARTSEREEGGPSRTTQVAAGAVSRVKKVARFAISPRA